MFSDCVTVRGLLTSLAICVLHVSGTHVSMSTKYGWIKGTFSPDEGVTRFLGVPYAQAPVGERRFARPAEMKPWEEELDCYSYRPACPQLVVQERTSSSPSNRPTFSEDCLYLNIVVPGQAESIKSLPVLVFLHDGMFQVGSAESVHGTNFAVKNNAIVVTLNYRLGVMGFFGNNNYGLWDQNMALRWIQDNVDQFGGSPEKVSLAGSGSGAFAAGLHALADVSNSLFKRVIMLEGSPYQNDYIVSSERAKNATDLFYEKLNCRLGDIQCLRNLPVEKILEAQEQLSNSKAKFVVRRDGHFVPRPSDERSNRNVSSVTVSECIIGLNVNNEGFQLVTDSLPTMATPHTIEEFTAENYNVLSQAITHLIALEYGKEFDSLQTIRRDAVAGSIRAGQKRMAEAGITVFAYINTSPESTNPGSLMSPSMTSESPIMFSNLENDASRLMREFLHHGKPSLKSNDQQFEWPAFTNDTHWMLVLDGETPLGPNTLITQFPESIERRMSLWADTVPSMVQACENCDKMEADRSDGPILNLPQGQVRGQTTVLEDGFTFELYQGIPFAMPPIGDLRFKPPQPHPGWNGVLEPQKVPISCPQLSTVLVTIPEEFSEDCLFLDVYVPRRLEQSSERKLPVMFFVHGGGFTMGSKNIYNGAALTMHDVIVVTTNYRLGVLGFMSTEDDVAPGNYGLMDQILAMKWVKQNIETFGGDPVRITIFGESAGAMSVVVQMLIPTNKGLFQNVLAQSGGWSGGSFLTSSTSYRSSTIDVAKSHNCSTFNSHAIVDCLRRIDPITLSGLPYIPLEKQVDISFFPRVDGHLIPKPFDELFKDGVARDYRFMTGTTQDEGYMFIAFMKDIILKSELLDPAKLVGQAFRHFYRDLLKVRARGGGANDTEFVRMGTDFSTDYVITAGCDQDAKLNSRHGGTTYRYLMSFHSAHPGWPGFFDNADWTLGSHGEDLYYTFGAPLIALSGFRWFLPDNFTWPEKDVKLSKRMVMAWTNFAHTGNPNKGPWSFDYEWPVYTEEQPLVFVFRDKLEEARGRDAVINRNEHPAIFRPKAMAFWNEVMPRLHKLDKEREACLRKDEPSMETEPASSAHAQPEDSGKTTEPSNVDGSSKSHEEL